MVARGPPRSGPGVIVDARQRDPSTRDATRRLRQLLVLDVEDGCAPFERTCRRQADPVERLASQRLTAPVHADSRPGSFPASQSFRCAVAMCRRGIAVVRLARTCTAYEPELEAPPRVQPASHTDLFGVRRFSAAVRAFAANQAGSRTIRTGRQKDQEESPMKDK